MSGWPRAIALALLLGVGALGVGGCADPAYLATPVSIDVRVGGVHRLDATAGERQVLLRVHAHAATDPERRRPVVFDELYRGTAGPAGGAATPLRFTAERPTMTVFLVSGTYTFEAVAMDGAREVGEATADRVTIGPEGTTVTLTFTPTTSP